MITSVLFYVIGCFYLCIMLDKLVIYRIDLFNESLFYFAHNNPFLIETFRNAKKYAKYGITSGLKKIIRRNIIA